MIQLANDPNASRTSYRPVQSEGEGRTSSFDSKPGRSAHSWPFLSRYAARPATRQDDAKPSRGTESGS